MAVLAAHTGARRSEMLRARVEDVDFEAGVVHDPGEEKCKVQNENRRGAVRSPAGRFLVR
jgi:integrase